MLTRDTFRTIRLTDLEGNSNVLVIWTHDEGFRLDDLVLVERSRETTLSVPGQGDKPHRFPDEDAAERYLDAIRGPAWRDDEWVDGSPEPDGDGDVQEGGDDGPVEGVDAELLQDDHDAGVETGQE